MKKVNLPGVAVFILCLFLHCFFSLVVQADETSIFTISQIKPNILFILDNSNSMDEDFYGNCVCSWRTGSRSVESRRSLTNLVNTYSDSMRLGLMTFRLPGASQYQLHNGEYFVSYDPRTYCPNPPADCSNYCYTDDPSSKNACNAACVAQNPSFDATYTKNDDAILSIARPRRDRYCDLIYPKTQAIINPADPTHFIYYKTPGTFYDPSNYGNAFCYSGGGYSTGDYPVTNNYSCYQVKTGTSDGDGVGYSSYWFGGGFQPTDEDFALGFYNFGDRQDWQYSGRTWFANTSPGDGFLQVAVADNPSDNTQRDALRAKLTLNENNENAYMACGNTGNPNNCTYVVNAGLTPTAGTFQSAVNYLQGGSSPIQYWCQKNFVVFVTDGLPSVNESGGADTATNLMPAVLSKITALRTLTKSLGGTAYNFDIETYVLGMGLSATAKTQLDAMAVAGGTAVNTHAYYADNPTQLATELNNILQDIVEKTYSFSTASVASNRVSGDNFLYEAAFDPKNNQSFWPGHVIKYALGSNGSVTGIDTNWCGTAGDAAVCLASRSAGTRTMKTFKSGSFVDFTTANITQSDLGVSTDADRLATIGYMRGESAYKTDGLKLGDIFHSNPIHVGFPSAYYDAPGFAGFRSSSTVANRPAVVVVGANDGQLHAFRASDAYELWSILPTNLLPELNAFLTTTTHHYLLDGQISVVDANLGTTTTPDWKSILIIGEGRGGQAERWSSSPSCDSGFSSTYATTNPYYCGYWAFDLTDTANPAVISSSVTSTGWTYPVIKPTAANAPYLGEPWSRMTVGKVRFDNSGTDKWVAFVGGGYGSADCNGGGGCNTAEKKKGKGFYVIDLADGSVLWSYTNSNDSNMQYSFPAHPGIVDTDSDGYIDTAYIGDMGGNMWRFKFCAKTDIDANSCSTSIWTGGKLLNAPSGGPWAAPLYNYPSVTKDKAGNTWVFWATGDKSDPTNHQGNTAGKVIGLKDNDRSTTYNNGDLQNVTNPSQACDNASKDGWYISFSGDEKAISDITVFGGIVYFTTYVPSSSTNPCDVSGYSNIYAINYLTCGGMLDPTNSGTLVRSMFVSYGIASAPIVSMRPGGGVGVDLYITQSGGGGQNAGTVRVNFNPPTLANKTNMLFWRDLRLQ
jgi:type IV pilus assembly protein PilY1